jgi:Na+/H+ antiporter NhaC
MRKIITLLLVLISYNIFAQKIEISNNTLSNIGTHIKIANLPDSLKELTCLVSADKVTEKIVFKVKNNSVDTLINFSNIGVNYIKFKGFNELNTQIRVLPGILSVIPPLLAIILALVLRQVIVSLFIGIFTGALFLYNYNPLTALLRVADTIMLNSLIDKNHALIILFTFLMGGVIGVISKNGGMVGLANRITKLAKTPKSGMIATWLTGVIIFFDDYSNSLIVGNMMRPITDKLKISREKLAYIVDSTSAPVTSLFIISTWIGFELGLIEDGLKVINSGYSAYDVFLQTIQYRFYPISTLFFVLLVSLSNRDFGPMLKAEKDARAGLPLKGIDEAEAGNVINDKFLYKGDKARAINALIPIAIILFGTIIGLYYTDLDAIKEQGIKDYTIRTIISNSNSYLALLWSSLAAGIVAIFMSISQKILNLHQSFNAWTKGIEGMLFANLILVFAWGISLVTDELNTAEYIISVIGNSIDPRWLPVLVFIICAITSFSTGTSWGTMAIVMPIVIPLGHKLSISAGLNSIDTDIVLYGVVSSVLAGSVFGDHCSPIADTTILSSLASGCNHVEHVRTQLPYAILVALVCIIIGDIPTAFGLNPIISILLIFLSLYIIFKYLSVKVS